MRYVVIGSGVAGITALKEILKKSDKYDEIHIISKDDYPFYYRPRLIEVLSGDIDFKDIIIHDINWFKEKNVYLILKEMVAKINPKKKYVETDKERYYYNKLLIASGAHSFVPPIKGVEKNKVYTLRNIQDAKEIYNQSKISNSAVVVGGGLLGLESAYNLLKAGLDVSVLEVADWILPRQLDQASGERLQNILEEKGLKIKTGVKIKCFDGTGKNVKAVKLENGESISADMVLLSTGIRCNHNYAQDVEEIKIDKGIVVNEFMETSSKDIYAAGDVTNYNNHLYGLWKPAQEQGKIAGKNMIGDVQRFSHFPPSQRLKVVGVDVVSIGSINSDFKNIEEHVQNDGFQKVFKDDENKIKGFISIGSSGSFDTKDIIDKIQSQK